jgi:hypothetical protein
LSYGNGFSKLLTTIKFMILLLSFHLSGIKPICELECALNFNMSLGIKRVVVVRKDNVHNDAPQVCSMEFETLGVFPKSL